MFDSWIVPPSIAIEKRGILRDSVITAAFLIFSLFEIITNDKTPFFGMFKILALDGSNKIRISFTRSTSEHFYFIWNNLFKPITYIWIFFNYSYYDVRIHSIVLDCTMQPRKLYPNPLKIWNSEPCFIILIFVLFMLNTIACTMLHICVCNSLISFIFRMSIGSISSIIDLAVSSSGLNFSICPNCPP